MLSKKLTEKNNNIFFDQTNTLNGNASFGHIVFQPNERIPKEGFGQHEYDEYSFVISGEAHSVVGGVEQVAKAGMAMYIPAGEPHYTYNAGDAPFEVVYALVKR